jgi:hypothetical protein
MGETAKAIRDLGDRLNKNKVTFLDVLRAFDKQVVSVTGEPAVSEDPEVVLALEDMAIAMATAFIRQHKLVLEDMSFGIGRGVALGTYGASFFDKIQSKQ